MICKYSECNKLYYLNIWDFEQKSFRELARGKFGCHRTENDVTVWYVGKSMSDYAAYCVDGKNRLQCTPSGCENILWCSQNKKQGFLYKIAKVYFIKDFDKDKPVRLGTYETKSGAYVDYLSETEYKVSIDCFSDVEFFYRKPYEVHGNVMILPRDDGFFDLVDNGCRMLCSKNEKVIKTSNFDAKIFRWHKERECYQMVYNGRYIGH